MSGYVRQIKVFFYKGADHFYFFHLVYTCISKVHKIVFVLWPIFPCFLMFLREPEFSGGGLRTAILCVI